MLQTLKHHVLRCFARIGHVECYSIHVHIRMSAIVLMYTYSIHVHIRIVWLILLFWVLVAADTKAPLSPRFDTLSDAGVCT